MDSARPVSRSERPVGDDRCASIVQLILSAELGRLCLVGGELCEASGVHEFAGRIESDWRQGGDCCRSAGGLHGRVVNIIGGT